MVLSHSTAGSRAMRTVVAAIAAALVASVGVVVSASSPAKAASPAQNADVSVAMAVPEFPDMVAAFRRAHPTVTEKDAVDRVSRQHIWIKLVDELSARLPDAFGGSWYDGDTDTLHLQVVDPAAEASFRAAAAVSGVILALHPARYSLRYLEQQYFSLVNGDHDLIGAAAAGSAGIDVRANRVVAGVAPGDVAKIRAQVGNGPIAVVERTTTRIVPQACTDRWHCGRPLRAGIALWESPDSWSADPTFGDCSLGFTATASGGGEPTTHWALTAGHCAFDTDPASCTAACWRHGEQFLGPMRQTVCASGCHYTRTSIDVGRIRVSNSYWLGGTWGWLYNSNDPDSPVPIRQRAVTYGDLPTGASICLMAQWSNPASGSSCGVLGTGADLTALGLARVDGLSACSGDSGGGWYLPNGGNRRAVGIHQGSTRPNPDPIPSGANCRLTGSSRHAYFSAFPAIDLFFDTTANATIRVDTR